MGVVNTVARPSLRVVSLTRPAKGYQEYGAIVGLVRLVRLGDGAEQGLESCFETAGVEPGQGFRQNRDKSSRQKWVKSSRLKHLFPGGLIDRWEQSRASWIDRAPLENDTSKGA
jgi:hypothetical protein